MPDGSSSTGELSAFHSELLTVLEEECGEVIIESCKARRFMPDTVWQDDTPRRRLSRECGDLVSVVSELLDYGVLDHDLFVQALGEKPNKLRTWMKHHPEEPTGGA